MINKVEICGVNTSKLPVLTNKEKDELFIRIKQGDESARAEFIKGFALGSNCNVLLKAFCMALPSASFIIF